MRSSHPAAGLLPETEPYVDLTAPGIHNAKTEFQNMSDPGLSERSRVEVVGARSSPREHEPPAGQEEANSIMSAQREASTSFLRLAAGIDTSTQTMLETRSPVEMRVHFDEFAAQLRSHRDREYKRRMLEHRRNGLRKGVALSARLQRLTSWIHDGLVEIGSHHDATSFVHVHQALQDLTDTCFAHWNQDIQAMDPVNSGGWAELPRGSEPILTKLTPEARNDCLEFIHSVRSNPRFLIDRFKAVSSSQLATLSTSPRFQDLSASVLTSLSQNRGRSSQKKRVQSYSKILEDYASSFERKNPMSFLLYNCFGPNSRSDETLRLSTWSAVCAGLYQEAKPAFYSIIKQVLSNFSTMRAWRAKDRLELFLMDVLQRGAFLLEPVGEYRSKAVLQTYISDTLDTDGAREFFDNAARQLFAILYSEDGGYPLGAIEFCRALLSQLPEDAQASVRTFLAFDWFLDEFLRITITYPENEKMLLQFHIGESARVHILHQLWFRAQARARDVFIPEKNQPVDPAIAAYFNSIISQIYAAEPLTNPYEATPSSSGEPLSPDPSFLTICATDIVHVLEALSQQYIPVSSPFDSFLTSSLSAFNSQYARANRYDRLKRELLVHIEPGYTTTRVHPCHEHWMIFPLGRDGKLSETGLPKISTKAIQSTPLSRLGSLNLVQEAAVKLALEQPWPNLSSSPRQGELTSRPLTDLILEKLRDTRSAAENIDSYYWQRALNVLENEFSPATWMINESRIFKSILNKLGVSEPEQDVSRIEQEVKLLESAFTLLKTHISAASMRLGRLKIKIWYAMDITNSDAYDKAKNISRALNYMALSGHNLPETIHSAASDRDRPGTSASTTSSMLEQPRIDAMNILKASKEHGGPRKLADDQIEMTKRWLDRNNVENFCKGEERIHRFCMEIKMATKKLVGESISDSPVLWSSELWAKEKNLFDVGGPNVFGPASSTRPPSVMSETLSSAQYSARPSIRTLDSGTRSLDADLASSPGRKTSFFSLGSHRFNRDLLGSEFASSISTGRSLTTTSGESASTLFSPLPSLGRSNTSISSQSRAASIYNDFANLKLTDPTSEKAFFLDSLQHELTCLLLSDLGNPVWSRGSETDSWLDGARENASILQCLSRRKVMSSMLPLPQVEPKVLKRRKLRPGAKRWCSDDSGMRPSSSKPQAEDAGAQALGPPFYSREDELQDVLDRLSHQVDPEMKLQAVHDFKQLALAFSAESKADSDATKNDHGITIGARRRQSVGPGAAVSNLKQIPRTSALRSTANTENDIVEELKSVLLKLRPTTLFRDLQYIAAFISIDALSDSEARRAFVHMGLAALASKDEICRCMVDIADQIIAKDSIKRIQPYSDLAEQPLLKARDYWILAAREGNAIAQRELAGLYLAHPELPSIISLPLTLSQDVFKNEMKWENREDETNTQALCLALHWMQAAADNGDEIAKRRIRERKDTAETSFR